MTSANARIEAILDEVELVPDDLVPWALGRLEVTRAALWSRLAEAKTLATPEPGPQPRVEESLLTAAEVAECLRVSERWVYRHAKELRAVRLSEHRVRFPESGVRRFLKRRSQ
jgi:excisionase family DNA binding protein